MKKMFHSRKYNIANWDFVKKSKRKLNEKQHEPASANHQDQFMCKLQALCAILCMTTAIVNALVRVGTRKAASAAPSTFHLSPIYHTFSKRGTHIKEDFRSCSGYYYESSSNYLSLRELFVLS